MQNVWTLEVGAFILWPRNEVFSVLLLSSVPSRTTTISFWHSHICSSVTFQFRIIIFKTKVLDICYEYCSVYLKGNACTGRHDTEKQPRYHPYLEIRTHGPSIRRAKPYPSWSLTIVIGILIYFALCKFPWSYLNFQHATWSAIIYRFHITIFLFNYSERVEICGTLFGSSY